MVQSDLPGIIQVKIIVKGSAESCITSVREKHMSVSVTEGDSSHPCSNLGPRECGADVWFPIPEFVAEVLRMGMQNWRKWEKKWGVQQNDKTPKCTE